MLTYKSDKKFKDRFVAEVIKHREADQIVEVTYGNTNGHWKGCAVACSLRSLDIIEGRPLQEDYDQHSAFEARGLWPEWLAHLEDTLFEGLAVDDALTWPERLAQAVPVGVDLEPVKWKFCSYLLRENIDRVLTLSIDVDLKNQVIDAIQGVLALHETALATGWDASAASAALSAAVSAALSAESAAASAALSAAESARSAAFKRYADELLRLLGEAKCE